MDERSTPPEPRPLMPTEAVYGPCSCGQARVRQSEWASSGKHRGHRMYMAVAIDWVPIIDRRHRDRRAVTPAADATA